MSTFLPRTENLRSADPKSKSDELLDINNNSCVINGKLLSVSSFVSSLYVVEHPQFLTKDNNINDSLFTRDCLHLSFEGTEAVVSNTESAILEVGRDMMIKTAIEMLQLFIDSKEENLP